MLYQRGVLVVGRSFGRSVTFYFFTILFLWPHCSYPKGLATSNMAPAHSHATSVVVYPALFFKTLSFENRLSYSALLGLEWKIFWHSSLICFQAYIGYWSFVAENMGRCPYIYELDSISSVVLLPRVLMRAFVHRYVPPSLMAESVHNEIFSRGQATPRLYNLLCRLVSLSVTKLLLRLSTPAHPSGTGWRRGGGSEHGLFLQLPNSSLLVFQNYYE